MIDPTRVVVLSPHLDDGILSCGQLLIAADEPCVVTVFTGMPPDDLVSTPYDEGCGFVSSAAAVKTRRVEDHNACSVVGARWFHCDALDVQYRDGAPALIIDDICAAINGSLHVVAPLGLCHPDHRSVSDAALSCGFDYVWLYEELPYRVHRPDEVVARLAELAELGVKLELDQQPIGDLTVKQQAARCYQSQIHAYGDLGSEHSWLVPERYWRVV